MEDSLYGIGPYDTVNGQEFACSSGFHSPKEPEYSI